MSDRHAHVLILGAGPGGYVAGIRAGQLGLDTLVVDAAPPGGTCLNVGCVPSKALIHVAHEFDAARRQADGGMRGVGVSNPTLDLAATVDWKDGIVARLNRGVAGLLDKAGAQLIEGWGTVVDGKTVDVSGTDGSTQRISCDHLVLATGSAPVELSAFPFDGDRVLSSADLLALDDLPRSLAVVGGGYIGLELGMAFARLGSRVTIFEAEDRLLPAYDSQLVAPVAAALDSLGVEVRVGTTADLGSIDADKVLVAVGRRPKVSGMGLANLGLTMDGRFLAVDDQGRTSMRNVWAVGDITGEPMLAHRAMKQGEVVAEAIAGHPTVFDPRAIPAIVFTDPEIVTVGIGPDEAQAAGLEVVVGRFPLAANARSMTLGAGRGPGEGAGFVRAVARADDHLIVGLQAVGHGVAELAAAFGLALEMGARLEDVADTIHAHPTVGESLAEACHAALGQALHF